VSDSTDIPEGYKATELGALPEEWNIGKLDHVGILIRGVSYKETDLGETLQPGFLPVLRAMNIQTGSLDLKSNLVFVRREKVSEKQILKYGDIVIAMSSGSKSIVGKAAQIHDDWNGSFGAFCAGFRTQSKTIDKEFIGFLFQTTAYREYIEKSACGTNIKNLTIPHILNYPIPLPPLPEQHAIATTLRTVQEAQEKTHAVIAATKALKAAMMKHLFTYGPVPLEEAERVALRETEIGPVPEEWDVVDLEKILKIPVRNGYALNQSKAKEEVRTYKLTAVTKNDFSYKYTKKIGVDPSKLENYWLTPGDIFIARANTPEYVGLAALYRGEEKYAIFTDLLVLVRVDVNIVVPKFLLEFLRMPVSRRYYQSRLKHTAGNFPKIDQNIINATKVPLPPLKDQKIISEIIETLDQKLAAEQSRKEALDTHFASLLHALMTAKIRVSTA